jgi:hypothetical protein
MNKGHVTAKLINHSVISLYNYTCTEIGIKTFRTNYKS